MARALCEQGNFDRAMECLIQGRHLESADTGELQVMQEEVAAMKELFAQVGGLGCGPMICHSSAMACQTPGGLPLPEQGV
eukprot:scaffold567_cov384-Prasinococcus_capsulatus_cf.AAC.10